MQSDIDSSRAPDETRLCLRPPTAHAPHGFRHLRSDAQHRIQRCHRIWKPLRLPRSRRTGRRKGREVFARNRMFPPTRARLANQAHDRHAVTPRERPPTNSECARRGPKGNTVDGAIATARKYMLRSRPPRLSGCAGARVRGMPRIQDLAQTIKDDVDARDRCKRYPIEAD